MRNCRWKLQKGRNREKRKWKDLKWETNKETASERENEIYVGGEMSAQLIGFSHGFILLH